VLEDREGRQILNSLVPIRKTPTSQDEFPSSHISKNRKKGKLGFLYNPEPSRLSVISLISGIERRNHMKYPYHVEYTKFGSPVMRLPKEIELVETLLFSDIQGSSGEYFLSEIDRVLQGEIAYSEIAGNVCGIEIKRDFTRVIDTLADDGIGNACVIETKELRELIVIWSKLLKGASFVHEQMAGHLEKTVNSFDGTNGHIKQRLPVNETGQPF
jgi:hypothetical protein